MYLYLTRNVKLGIQNTKFKVINQHQNDMHHVQSSKKDFHHGTPISFYHIFTLETNILLALGSSATIIITFNLPLLNKLTNLQIRQQFFCFLACSFVSFDTLSFVAT
jgi:hypothetical protein